VLIIIEALIQVRVELITRTGEIKVAVLRMIKFSTILNIPRVIKIRGKKTKWRTGLTRRFRRVRIKANMMIWGTPCKKKSFQR